jgi:thiamine biosynthesis lipoprotein
MAAILAGCAPGGGPERLSGRAMGTTWEIMVTATPPGVGRADLEADMQAVLGEVDRHLSGWNTDSELVRFNASRATGWVPASPMLARSVRLAREVSAASGGAFDITVAPLVSAWGFGAEGAGDRPPPSSEEIARLLRTVGYDRLQSRLRPPALRKSEPALRLDLDGLAPGLAVDRVAARLEARGVVHYLVELGGEVRARGASPSGRPWRVAVEAPDGGERRAWAIVELDGLGVSTSGDYRDFRNVEGRRVSHTIDPRSGRPVEHGLASVTVLHRQVAVADAWATALMVLGPEQGYAMALQQRLPALFIVREPDGRLVERGTPEFERRRRPRAAGAMIGP